MTEKTVRPHSVLRRTILAATAGVVGGAVLELFAEVGDGMKG
jgi:hypothetical protein